VQRQDRSLSHLIVKGLPIVNLTFECLVAIGCPACRGKRILVLLQDILQQAGDKA